MLPPRGQAQYCPYLSTSRQQLLSSNSDTRLLPVSLTWLKTLICLHPDLKQFLFLAAQYANFSPKSSEMPRHYKHLETGAAAAQVTRG